MKRNCDRSVFQGEREEAKSQPNLKEKKKRPEIDRETVEERKKNIRQFAMM